MGEKKLEMTEPANLEPDDQYQAPQTSKLHSSSTEDDRNSLGSSGLLGKDGTVKSKIPIRTKSPVTTAPEISKTYEDKKSLYEESEKINSTLSINKNRVTKGRDNELASKAPPPSNPKDRLSGRFISWDQAKGRPDQGSVIYPSVGQVNRSSVDRALSNLPRHSSPGSGLKYGTGPLAEKLKNLGIEIVPMTKSPSSASTPVTLGKPERLDLNEEEPHIETTGPEEKEPATEGETMEGVGEVAKAGGGLERILGSSSSPLLTSDKVRSSMTDEGGPFKSPTKLDGSGRKGSHGIDRSPNSTLRHLHASIEFSEMYEKEEDHQWASKHRPIADKKMMDGLKDLAAVLFEGSLPLSTNLPLSELDSVGLRSGSKVEDKTPTSPSLPKTVTIKEFLESREDSNATEESTPSCLSAVRLDPVMVQLDRRLRLGEGSKEK
jgi:hypothetical protein